MSEENTMIKDTKAIIIAIVMAVVAIIGINKADISEVQTEIRKLRGLLIAHIPGHSHTLQDVAKVGGSEAKPQ